MALPSRSHCAAGHRSRRLTLESLEDRRVMAFGDQIYAVANPNPALKQEMAEAGRAVAIHDNRSLVALPRGSFGIGHQGGAYLFDNSTGEVIHRFINPDLGGPLGPTNAFGSAVALSSEIAVIGASTIRDSYGNTNAYDNDVYLFDLQDGTLSGKITSTHSSDAFGTSLDLEGQLVAIGAPYDNTGADRAGAIHLYNTGSGSIVRTIYNPLPNANDNFGAAVSISSDFVIVGAPNDENAEGRCYVFRISTGELVATLTAPDAANGDNFGSSVAIEGSVAAVGAFGKDDLGANSGAAFLYNIDTQSLVHTLYEPVAQSGNQFGSAVDLADGQLVVGAWFSNTNTVNWHGAAYVFGVETGEPQAAYISPLAGQGGGRFGRAVGIDAGKVVIGSPDLNDKGFSVGAAFLYDNSTQGLLHAFESPAPARSDYFGQAFAATADRVVIGSLADDETGWDAGAAYLLNATDGAVIKKIANPGTEINFGASVAMNDEIIAIGATGKWLNESPGQVHLFDATTGEYLDTINAPNSPDEGFGNFGATLEISGNYLVIGQPHASPDVYHSGAVYVYDLNSRSLVHTILNPEPTANAAFGRSLAINGDQLIVSSPHEDNFQPSDGIVYVFDLDSGSLSFALSSPVASGRNRFGYSVDIDGQFIVVGAPGQKTSGSLYGTAYVFDAQTGAFVSELRNHAWNTLGAGYKVTIENGLVAVAGDPTEASYTASSVSVYNAADGTVVQLLLNPSADQFNAFGQTLAFANGRLFIAAPRENGISFDRGAVYAFDVQRDFQILLPGTASYREGAPPTLIATDATVAGVLEVANGKLTVSLGGGNPMARITVRDAGGGAGQIGIRDSFVTYEGVIIGQMQGGVNGEALIIDLYRNTPSAVVQTLLRSLQYESSSDHPPTQEEIHIEFQSSSGVISDRVTRTLPVEAINDRPVVADLGADITYKENAAPITVAPTATITDVDSTNFAHGMLMVRIVENAEWPDRLTIRNAGMVTTRGNEVLFGEHVIGTWAGGVGGVALTVSFNGKASPYRAQAVLRNVAYSSLSENPSALPRTVRAQLTDGDGGLSPWKSKTINVVPVNDVHKIALSSAPIGYQMNAANIAVMPEATLTDVDNAHFGGGKLVVRVTEPDASNRLEIGGGFTVVNQQVIIDGVVIGTLSWQGGIGERNLAVTFNSNATVERVENLLRSIRFRTVGATVAKPRTLEISLLDGAWPIAKMTKTVNVST